MIDFALGLSVHEEFDRIAVGNDVHGLGRTGRISPMPDDMDVGLVVLHDAIGVVGLLG